MINLIQYVACLILLLASYAPVLSQQGQPALDKPISKALQEQHLDHLDLRVTHTMEDQTGQIWTYIQQYHADLEIYKSIGVHVEGTYGTHLTAERWITAPYSDHNSKSSIPPQTALMIVAKDLALPLSGSTGKWTKSDGQHTVKGLPYASGDVTVSNVWVADGSRLIPAYKINLDPAVNADMWEIIVSQENGNIIERNNHTTYCHWGPDHTDPSKTAPAGVHQHDPSGDHKGASSEVASSNSPISVRQQIADGSSYRVWAPPLESPDMGDRTLVVEPADEIASPYGWHDTNGREGADSRFLRGNNVYAYQDTADIDEPRGRQTDGGAGLTFDFPFDPDKAPIDNLDADVTNLFYWNNYVHDWAFRLGFDEAAGNFQFTNYTNQGDEGDQVFAETIDGSSTNNASFSSPRDGNNGRMQMFEWILGGEFEILSPSVISGQYQTGAAAFGPILEESLEGTIALARDGTAPTGDVCEPISNTSELQGKIALIDRGLCHFSLKTYRAQLAGAKACIICNNLDNAPLITMSGGDNADDVTIPAVFISKEDCQLIKDQIAAGQMVRGEFSGIRKLSSALDNGIVAHEYGHGISTRLSGGPSNSSCLNNDEQAGEGWSDFFGLVLTQDPHDTRDTPRPIGTYVTGQDRTDGRGIRRYPYSTDMTVNPQIHSHIRFSSREHDIGEIWTNILWDLYWDYIDTYGYDPTWQQPNSGNAQMVRTVLDGLRLQPCDASLTEARSAIISADAIGTGGANACMIWRAFARRGLGQDAIAGDGDDRADNVDGFSIPLSCYDTLAMTKFMTPTFDPGDVITVQINLENQKESLSNIEIRDQIPSDMTVVSIPTNARVEDGQIIFSINNILKGQQQSYTYELQTNEIQYVDFEMYDDMSGATQFSFDRLENSQANLWRYSNAEAQYGPVISISPDTLGGVTTATLRTPITIDETSRLFRFDHKYDIDLGIDGGFVEVSTDQGESWTQVAKEQFLVNGYPDNFSDCFNNCPAPDFFYRNVKDAYTGQRGWATSVIDLINYQGQEVRLRFNYSSRTWQDELTNLGWVVDNIELYEMKQFATHAYMVDGQDTLQTAIGRTLVNSDAQKVPTTEVIQDEYSLSVYPNPATRLVTLSIESQDRYDAQISIIGVDGRAIYTSAHEIKRGAQDVPLDISTLSPGMYFVDIQLGNSAKETLSFIKI